MAKPAEAAEKARPDNDKRIVRIRIRVIEVNNAIDPTKNTYRIITELEDPTIQRLFNQRDFEDFDDLQEVRGKARLNTDKRKNTLLHAAERKIAATERVHADDYPGEPPYLHSGIHLLFRTGDEIEWFCPEAINFMIDVGHDSELHRLKNDLPENVALPKASMKAVRNGNQDSNPFVDPFPKFCVNGAGVRSGVLRKQGNAAHPDVKAQKYHKFSITILGTDVTLDPHVDLHDD
jgi:hypothetical protein